MAKFRAYISATWIALNSDKGKARLTTVFFYAVAGCILYVGWRVVFCKTKTEEAKVALLLFASAAGVVLAREVIWLLPKIQKVKFKDFEFSMRDRLEKLENRTEVLNEDVFDIRESQGRVGASKKAIAEDVGKV